MNYVKLLCVAIPAGGLVSGVLVNCVFVYRNGLLCGMWLRHGTSKAKQGNIFVRNTLIYYSSMRAIGKRFGIKPQNLACLLSMYMVENGDETLKFKERAFQDFSVYVNDDNTLKPEGFKVVLALIFHLRNKVTKESREAAKAKAKAKKLQSKVL